MAELSLAATAGDDVLEWVQKDKRRFLRAVYRVGDLNRTIEFYTELFGMQLLEKGDNLEEKYSYALLGFGPEETHFVLKLIYKAGVDKLDIGTGFSHFGISTLDIYTMVENIRAKGGVITREPGTLVGTDILYAFVQEPNGYNFELVQISTPIPNPLSHLALNVADLDRAVKFYEEALGMRLIQTFDNPQEKYTVTQMGYAARSEATVLELRYNYGVTEYIKGNGYKHLAICTEDVYKSAEAVKLVTQKLGGMLILPPTSIPGINIKLTSFSDPDGYETVLVEK